MDGAGVGRMMPLTEQPVRRDVGRMSMAKRSPRDRAPGHPGPELSDKDHEFILRNPKANEEQATEAIARAMAEDGMTREEAEDLYGLKGRDAGDL